MATRHPLHFGIKLSGQDTTIADLRAFWRIAEEAGFDHGAARIPDGGNLLLADAAGPASAVLGAPERSGRRARWRRARGRRAYS